MKIKLIHLNNHLRIHFKFHQFKRHSSIDLKLINRRSFCSSNESINYKQGQYAKENSQIREYFYFINEEGYLFLDDTRFKNFTSCFKDRQFIKFFFDRIQFNTTDRFTNQFPYLSRCGYERNYIRCDDVPIVYTHVLDNNLISFNYAAELLVTPFNPQDICMCSQSGRLYYPTSNPKKFGEIGLIRSKLSIELSKHFIFDFSTNQIENKSKDNLFDQPIAIEWNNNVYQLSQKLEPLLRDHFSMRSSKE